MIYAEFKVTDKKCGDTLKKLEYEEWMVELKEGTLIDVDFPLEGIILECVVKNVLHVSNGKDLTILFELTSPLGD